MTRATRGARPVVAVASLALLALALFVSACARGGSEPPATFSVSVGAPFAEALDLDGVRLLAVQDGGRVKTFDSLAREKLKLVVGRRVGSEVDPVLLYLDMMLVPEHHAGQAGIHIRKKPVRQRIVQMVRSAVPAESRTGEISDEELDRVAATGHVSIAFLDHPAVRNALQLLERDLMAGSKEVDKIWTARALADAGTLTNLLRVVPPPGGDPLDPWFSLDAVQASGAPNDATHAQARRTAAIPGLDGERADRIAGAVDALASSWRFQDAAAANGALATLVAELPGVEPALYPGASRLSWEQWYYRNNKLTATWIVYFLALPPLLLSVVYGFRWARVIGLGLFVAAFGLHTASIAIRWYLAGRIPNANMFEAVTAAAWFGVATALVLELVLRRWPLRNLPALAASTGAMTAMMVGHFLPITLNNDIAPVMPVLDRTIWLYIHTNMIIASYALIFFASVTAALYLALWVVHHVAPASAVSLRWAGAGGPGALAAGGAGSVILGRGLSPGGLPEGGLAKVLDGTTMIFLELAFVTLWFGTILGAAWADVSWGRPWGWDPKEVFALNTWLVFLVLVHVRLKVKDKGFWTAVLAVIGCLVMLFNWIVVNFVIVGLHSYA